MNSMLPILILAGSDRKPGPVGPGLTREAMLSGFKGALLLRSGRPLLSVLVQRLRACGRFQDPIVVGPRELYGPLVDCDVIDVTGNLAATLGRVLELLRTRFSPDQPVAIVTCDILPTAAELSELLESGYDPHNTCQFWWQIVAAEAGTMGASAWKPHYRLQLEGDDRLQTVYPGHLVIVRPEGLRLDLLQELLVLAYRYRNRPLARRFLPMFCRGLGLLIRQDLTNLTRGQWPVLTVSLPWHLLRAAFGIVRGRLTRHDFERHLAKTVVHRRFLQTPRPFVVQVTRIRAFGQDIDTLAELDAAEG